MESAEGVKKKSMKKESQYGKLYGLEGKLSCVKFVVRRRWKRMTNITGMLGLYNVDGRLLPWQSQTYNLFAGYDEKD